MPNLRKCYPWENITPRNIWWFRKEMQRISKLEPGDINRNASGFKWAYSFVVYLCEHRTRLGLWQRQPRQIHAVKAFVEAYGEKIFGVPVVITGSIVVPKKFCKKVFVDEGDGYHWYWESLFDDFRSVGDIRWCDITKKWWGAASLYTVVDYELLGRKDGKPQYLTKQILVGGKANIWACPTCQTYIHNIPKNKTKNIFGQLSCLKCGSTEPKNKPHTEDTIYGDYHSHYRGDNKWKFFPCFVNFKKDKTFPIGVELEIQIRQEFARDFNPKAEAWSLYEQQLEFNKNWNLFYFERDGSLGAPGIEMITQPMSLELHNKFWSKMLPRIRRRFCGWNTTISGHSNYGIHLTFAMDSYGPLHVARLGKFLERRDNGVLVQAIAQRGVLYGTSSFICAENKTLNNIFTINDGKLTGSITRSQPVNVKGSLVEIRMFKTSLNQQSFMKNLEFLYAFKEWCNETSYSIHYMDFINWMLASPLSRYTKYPNLYNYLCRPKFPVKNPAWPVDNLWAPNFTNVVYDLFPGQRDLFTKDIPQSDADYNNQLEPNDVPDNQLQA